MILYCTDSRCADSNGRACIVASIEDGMLVLTAKHRGERHITRIPVDDLIREPVVSYAQ